MTGASRMRDLSHPIVDGMPVYPGDPTVHLHAALDLARDGVAVTGLRMGSHTGTHVDAPSHTVAGGRTMADVSLDELVGDALVLRVLDAQPREVLGWDRLLGAAAGTGSGAAAIGDRVPSIVVVDTGWARWLGDARATEHPAIDADAARELWARGMRLLAVDALSPDPTGGDGFPVHDVVLGGDGLIVENLCGLDGLPQRTRIGFFPLRLGGDGAPVRAVAFG